MIKLRNNPIEGSSLRLGISFMDAYGCYYVPVMSTWSMLALNNDKESWRVVDGIYKKELEPASAVTLTTPPSKLIEGTSLERKILVEWTAFVDGTYTDFVDEVEYSVQPRPYVSDLPPEPTPSEMFVRVVSANLQEGSLIRSPLDPVFMARVNVPVDVPDGSVCIVDERNEDIVSCNVSLDETKSVLTIAPYDFLSPGGKYMLSIYGLVALTGGYSMREPFDLHFTATEEGRVQDVRHVTLKDAGENEIVPDEGFSSMGKVIADVDLPLQPKIAVENGIVLPDDGYYGLSSVKVSITPEFVALYAYEDAEDGTIYLFSRVVKKSGTYSVMQLEGEARFISTAVTVSEEAIRMRWNATDIVIKRNIAYDLLR